MYDLKRLLIDALNGRNCYGRPLFLCFVLFDFANIWEHDEAELSKNIPYYCQCVVANDAKVIYRFEGRVFEEILCSALGFGGTS